MTFALLIALAQLELHPQNPRYFRDRATGRAVLIAGFDSIVPSSSEDYGPAMTQQARRRVQYSRVWHLLPWDPSPQWPWLSVGATKWDLDQWNPTYWTRMKDALTRARDAQQYAELHLFDRCGMSPPASDRWAKNPWASDNNVNALETPPASSDGTPEFYETAMRPRLKAQQEKYVRKMLAETEDLPNVVYEIENEHWDGTDPAWASGWGRFVKAELHTPHLVSYSSLESDLDAMFANPNIDVINQHWGGEPEGHLDVLTAWLMPRWSRGKAINVDEFANGVTDPAMLRAMVWTIVTSGGHFHIEDAEASAKPYEVVENVHAFLATSGWDFLHARPVLRGSASCMEQAGVELVCFVPVGASVDAGALTARWWNSVSGGFTSARPSGDAVLFATSRALPVARLVAGPAYSDVTVTNAGDASEGVIARGGCFGSVCYGGGTPPNGPADFSATVQARHDAEAVYFRATVVDDDPHEGDGVDLVLPSGTQHLGGELRVAATQDFPLELVFRDEGRTWRWAGFAGGELHLTGTAEVLPEPPPLGEKPMTGGQRPLPPPTGCGCHGAPGAGLLLALIAASTRLKRRWFGSSRS